MFLQNVYLKLIQINRARYQNSVVEALHSFYKTDCENVLHLKLCSRPQQHLHQVCFDRALCSTWWGQGGKWHEWIVLSHVVHVVTWQWRTSERFFRAESPLPYWGCVCHVVLVCSRTPSSSKAMACRDITDLLTAWLLKKTCLCLELLALVDSDTG